jgi:hypothetical protein
LISTDHARYVKKHGHFGLRRDYNACGTRSGLAVAGVVSNEGPQPADNHDAKIGMQQEANASAALAAMRKGSSLATYFGWAKLAV